MTEGKRRRREKQKTITIQTKGRSEGAKEGRRRTVCVSQTAGIHERVEHYHTKCWWDTARAQGHVSF